MNKLARWFKARFMASTDVRDLIASVDASLQDHDSDTTMALRGTFAKVRERIMLLETLVINKSMSAKQAHILLQTMQNKDWTIVNAEEPTIRGLGDQIFTADQLEALAIYLRATDKEHIIALSDEH